LVAAAETTGRAKLVFVVFKRADVTREQSFAEWDGAKHVALVRRIPGLRKWVQNRVMEPWSRCRSGGNDDHEAVRNRLSIWGGIH